MRSPGQAGAPISGNGGRITWAVVATVIFVMTALPALGADVAATWNTDAVGDWSDPTNWSSDPLFPNNGDDTFDVSIHDGQVNLDGEFVIRNLTIDGGAVGGANNLWVNGPASWSGGSIGGDGLSGGGIIFWDLLTLDGGDRFLAGMDLFCNGGTVWTSGTIGPIEPPGGGAIINASLFDIQADVSWYWFAMQTPFFWNEPAGEVRKSGGSGTTGIDAVFNNNGTVRVESGELWLAGGGWSTGTFHVAPATQLTFSDYNEMYSGEGSPTTTLDIDSVVDSQGTVLFSNAFGLATTEISGTFDSPIMTVNPGTGGNVGVNQNSIFGEVTPPAIEILSGGLRVYDFGFIKAASLAIRDAAFSVVSGGGNVSFTGDVNIDEGGVLYLGDDFSSGNIDFSGGGTQQLNGPGEVYFSAFGGGIIAGSPTTLEIGSDVVVQGITGNIVGTPGSISYGQVFSNHPDGNFSISDIDNAGTFQVTGGADLSYSSATNFDSIVFDGGGNMRLIDVINNGTITSGASEFLEMIGLYNASAGIVTVDGANLLLAGHWQNDGSISVNNGDLSLSGNFASGSISGMTHTGTGGTRLAGILDNTGNMLTLDASTGSWGFAGTILNGTVVVNAPAQLKLEPFVISTLDGVTLNSPIVFQNSGSLSLWHDVTINTTLDLSAASPQQSSLSVIGDFGVPQTIGGTGTIIMGNTMNHNSNNLATIGPGITIRGRSASIDGFSGKYRFQGRVSADVSGGNFTVSNFINDVGGVMEAINGDVLRVAGTWDNNGTLNVGDNSFLVLGGTFGFADIGTVTRAASALIRLPGTMTNTGNSFDVTNVLHGPLHLDSPGKIVGGTVTSSGPENLLIASNFPGNPSVLDGVTLKDINLTYVVNASLLRAQNGLTLNNVIIDQTGLSNGLEFAGNTSQLFGGTGEVVFNTAGASSVNNVSTSGAVLTIGPGITIRGGGFSAAVAGKSNPLAGGIVHQGAIRSEIAGWGIGISNLTNQGTLQVDAGCNMSISGAFAQNTANALLRVDGSCSSTTGLDVTAGTVAGSGFIQIQNAAANPFVKVSNGAVLAPGGSIGTVTVAGNVVVGDGGHLKIEIAAPGSADRVSLIKPQFQSANGDLDLSSSDDYLDLVALPGIESGTDHIIATYAGSVIGTFNHVTPGYDVTYEAANKRIVVRPVSVQVDSDGDGVPDASDQCPATVPGASVGPDGCPPIIPGDSDRDGDVDTDDLERFEDCGSGPEVPADAECLDKDFDEDGDVDSDDFGLFQECLSGTNQPADPACID